MDAPPINVFGTLENTDFVEDVIRARFSNCEKATGEDGSILMSVYDGDLKFSINVNPNYFESDDHIQRRGLLGYLEQFAMTEERKHQLFDFVGHLRFAVSFMLEPALDAHPFLDVIHEVAERGLGVVFEPQMVKDCKGRLLASQGGDSDKDAVFPRYE